MRVAVLGAGQMGTAFGKPILDNGNELVYWGPEWIDTPALEALAANKPHPDLGVALPATVDTTSSIEEAVHDADLIALAVTGEGAEWVAPEAAKYTPEGASVMVFSKGLIEGDGGGIVAVPEFAQEVFGPSRKVVGVGGPVKAIDLIWGSPTQTAFAAANLDDARAACEKFAADYYFPGASDDLSGLGFCAALKNCYAIAFGMITGDDAKPNLRALAFGTALGEISRLVSAAGGRPETVTGAAGAGDLYVTCLSGRNGDFGRRLNTGAGREEALKDMNNATVEGLGTLPPALDLARSLDLGEEELPLLHKLDAVLREEESARDLRLADLLL